MFKCQHPGCHFEGKTPQSVSAHHFTHLTKEEKIARNNKRLATIAAQKNNTPKVDDIFERVEKATKILFPDPKVFYERFEEIAELRHAMLMALKR
jgi:hypothetical protein